MYCQWEIGLSVIMNIILVSLLFACDNNYYIVNREQGLVFIYLQFAQVSAIYQGDLLCALLMKLAGGFYVRVLQ